MLPNLKLRERCRLWSNHRWLQIGEHEVPCVQSWPNGEPGTAIYLDYECTVCGQQHSEEKLCSWRPQSALKSAQEKPDAE